MRKLISVYEPIGDGTKDRGEEMFCLICDETGIEKTKGMMRTMIERYSLPKIARVDCYRGDEVESHMASGALAGLLIGGVRGAVVGGMLTSSPSKDWWIEIELKDQTVHYFRLATSSGHEEFLKWAAKYGVKVEAAQTTETSEAPGTSETNTSSADEILKYKQLLDMGIITEEEFEAKKKQLLNL